MKKLRHREVKYAAWSQSLVVVQPECKSKQSDSRAHAYYTVSHEFLKGSNYVLFLFVYPMPGAPQIFVEWIKIYNFIPVIQEKVLHK